MDFPGPIILAAGALFGVWLGAVYASGRLERQLDEQASWFDRQLKEESKRLERQVDAESTRLDRQLAHDRRMRDREELRKTFDEAIAMMETAISGTAEVLAAAGVYNLVNRFIHEHLVAGEEAIDPKKAALAASYGMGGQHHRLKLRLYEHELARKYWSVRVEVLKILGNNALDKEKLTEDELKELKEASNAARKAAGEFVRMASDYLQSD